VSVMRGFSDIGAKVTGEIQGESVTFTAKGGGDTIVTTARVMPQADLIGREIDGKTIREAFIVTIDFVDLPAFDRSGTLTVRGSKRWIEATQEDLSSWFLTCVSYDRQEITGPGYRLDRPRAEATNQT